MGGGGRVSGLVPKTTVRGQPSHLALLSNNPPTPTPHLDPPPPPSTHSVLRDTAPNQNVVSESLLYLFNHSVSVVHMGLFYSPPALNIPKRGYSGTWLGGFLERGSADDPAPTCLCGKASTFLLKIIETG